MRSLLALTVVAALLAAGCISDGSVLDPAAAPEGDLSAITSVRDRASLGFVTEGDWSQVLAPGAFGILPGFGATVSVPAPVGEGLPEQIVHMGIFLPDIEGCDWSAEALDEACKVPVVADVGPYYGEPVLGDVHATQPANRLGKFLIDNLVPHGYAVAQVSVLGTGDSGGCMDLMGEMEQAGVQAAVNYLGETPWSNGAVGLIGRSYDGSTPWEAAMVGSPYLKTVVPISGLYGQYDLMWRNGSAEQRGPGVLWGLYYVFTYTGNDPATGTDGGNPTLQAQQIAENAVCPDTQTGLAHGLQAYATGAPAPTGWWQERSFKDEVLENYEGSVYFIHGMQDWNVDPHMAFPFYNELEAKGLEMKGLFGQWGHMYPDRPGEHQGCGDCRDSAIEPSVRWDWAQDLLEWFDHYLKGTGAKPELHVEMQDDYGRWRIEETWPAPDTNWQEFEFDVGGIVIPPATGALPTAPGHGEWTSVASFDRDVIVAGLPQLKLTVTPLGPGGQLYAELRDNDDGGRRLGHAIMDLRYAAGGQEMQPVVPGMPLEVHMEFLPMDAAIPAGHEIGVFISSTGRDYLPASTSAIIQLDGALLRLPVVERTADAFFAPPGATIPPLE